MNVRSGYGVGFGDELLMQFPFPVLAAPADYGPATERDVSVSSRLASLWAAFAATGFPKDGGEFEWQQSVESDRRYCHVCFKTVIVRVND